MLFMALYIRGMEYIKRTELIRVSENSFLTGEELRAIIVDTFRLREQRTEEPVHHLKVSPVTDQDRAVYATVTSDLRKEDFSSRGRRSMTPDLKADDSLTPIAEYHPINQMELNDTTMSGAFSILGWVYGGMFLGLVFLLAEKFALALIAVGSVIAYSVYATVRDAIFGEPVMKKALRQEHSYLTSKWEDYRKDEALQRLRSGGSVPVEVRAVENLMIVKMFTGRKLDFSYLVYEIG
jgi:hypothetical protein